ncbi:MAG: LPXTG cell wall anchor domain-containing protein, partial [Actinobacteria bacterium]|nr:LPXTG cell wall anchor domain-containing protein [Actinomycetota bacterium]
FSDCVVVDEGSVGLDVLQSALEVRAGDSGLICGIAGYPNAECGAEIEAPVIEDAVTISAPVQTEEETTSSAPILLGALAVMIVLTFLINRRRRK